MPSATEDYLDLTVDPDDVGELLAARSALTAVAGRLPAHHQLLGWPHLLQGSMHWTCQTESTAYYGEQQPPAGVDWDQMVADTTAADWQLLLQLGSDKSQEWCWGDGGALYLWINSEDLMTRHFDRVWTIMQC